MPTAEGRDCTSKRGEKGHRGITADRGRRQETKKQGRKAPKHGVFPALCAGPRSVRYEDGDEEDMAETEVVASLRCVFDHLRSICLRGRHSSAFSTAARCVGDAGTAAAPWARTSRRTTRRRLHSRTIRPSRSVRLASANALCWVLVAGCSAVRMCDCHLSSLSRA